MDALFQPIRLLSVAVLRARVVEDSGVGGKGLVHDFGRDVVRVRQSPQESKHFRGHDPLLVVLGQTADQLQQLFTLFLVGVAPTRLQTEYLNFFKPCILIQKVR